MYAIRSYYDVPCLGDVANSKIFSNVVFFIFPFLFETQDINLQTYIDLYNKSLNSFIEHDPLLSVKCRIKRGF